MFVPYNIISKTFIYLNFSKMSNSSFNHDVPEDQNDETFFVWPRPPPPPLPVPFINVIDAPQELLLPTQLPREQPLLPGPEHFENLQRARRRKLYHEASSSFAPEQPLMTTQMFYNSVVSEGDPDFNEVRWTSAIQYITESGKEWTPLNEIRVSRTYWRKINNVLVMIKEFEKNVFGDGMATVKDPTCTMGASFQKKVFLLDGVNEVLKVGAVVLVRNVAVCVSPRGENILNITKNNIVKVIGTHQMIAPMVIQDSEDEMD